MPTQLLINAKSGAVLRAGVEHCRALVGAHCPDEILEVVGSPAELIAAARAAAADPGIDRVLLLGGNGTAAAEGVKLRECKSCSVRSELKRLNITIDGEVTGIVSPAVFSIQPKALPVLGLIY